MKKILRAAGVLCAGIAFVACNAILGNEDGYRLVPGEAGPGCHSNSACPSGQTCLFEVCSPPCLGDLDCEIGARCLQTDSGTACVASTAAVCSGAKCPAGTTCSRGDCRNACTTSGDCLSGQDCVTRSTATVGRVCVGTDPTRDPDAPEPDGGGTGGAPSTGGAGGQAATGGRASGGQASGGGGAAPIVDAGDDAAADAGPCVATGPESCFNGKDDDCNGKLDCEDPACGDLGECVPDSPGATLGTFFNGVGPCPSGYSPVSIKRGIVAEYGCTGCSCVPNDSRCESGVYGHGPYPCPSYQFSGPLHNVFSHQCGSMPADTSVHYYNVRGFTTCTPQGTGTPNPASSTESATFCAANQIGGGCGSAGRCIPKIATPACAMAEGSGSCSPRYPGSTGDPWYTALNDTRACLECSCSFGTATCAGGYIAGYSGAACTGTAVQIGSGAEGDNCALPFVAASARVIGTPTNPSCPPNTGMTGEVTPKDPRNVCCLPGP